MNWLDFVYLGPTSIWVLSGAILFLALVCWKSSKQMICEVKSTTSELRKGTTELERFTSELRDDIGSLKQGNVELKEVIDNWYQTLRRYSFGWFK